MQTPMDLRTARTYSCDKIVKLYCTWKNSKNLNKNTSSVFDSDSDARQCFNYYEINKIKQCADKIIFIDCLKEGWHEHHTFNRYPNDKHYVIFSGANWDTNNPEYQLDISYTLIYFPYFLFDTIEAHTEFFNELYYTEKDYNFSYPKKLLFSSLSCTPREHRDYLVDNLLPKLDKETYAFKYSGKNYGKNIDSLDVIKSTDVQDQDRVVKDFCDYFSKCDRAHNKGSQHVPIDIFNNSYFNLITEADQAGSHFFPTEKIYKSLLSGIPFVCVTTQNFLHNIRQQGFRTYSELWSEDYDLEPDDNKRLEMITDLCVQLKNFDWQANREQLISISCHNRLQLLNISAIINQHFMDMEQILINVSNR